MNEETPILGNYYNKYNTSNPIERLLINNYRNMFKRIVSSLSINSVYEIGSGEGVLLKWIYEIRSDIKIIGSDISPVFDISLFSGFETKPKLLINNAENLPFSSKPVDLVIACEVLEHVFNPTRCLQELKRVNASYYLLSVPNDNLWRILNLFRLKYIKSLGNTPGHINHWNRKSFCKLISRYLNIEQAIYVQPWIFVLARGNH